MRVLYMEQAQKMEAADSLLEAEKLYLQVGEVSQTTGGRGGDKDTDIQQRYPHPEGEDVRQRRK